MSEEAQGRGGGYAMPLWRKKTAGRLEGKEKRGHAPESPGKRARWAQKPTPTRGPDTPSPAEAELGGVRAEARGPGSTLLPRPPSVPQSPASAAQAFCLSDLQLPGYRSSTPYRTAENRASAAASGRAMPSRRPMPGDSLLNSPPGAAGLGPAPRPRLDSHPPNGRSCVSYWLLVTKEAGGPSPCPHGKCSLKSLEVVLPGGGEGGGWNPILTLAERLKWGQGIVGDGVKALLFIYPQFLPRQPPPAFPIVPSFGSRRVFWML